MDTDEALTTENHREVFLGQFCLRTLPWYFLNRRRALTHFHTAEHYGVEFTGDVRTCVDVASGKLELTRGGDRLVDGEDLLMPAEWTDGLLL